MAIKRMLIDASHPEETRVVVVDGTRVEDYDVEVASRRQLKGNIYLAKVTRVEPSLQAAFVDYGGNRHGFLAFNEIHPDYYQIPVADRERLLAEHAAVDNIDRDDDTGAADDDEELERRRTRLTRYYKIQEVIKRRQIMLVQVAKEERGNKGAALTTYLSLAGRYCVLMPNTARGGGISRKIVGATDRKRLKKVLTELEVPEGMAVIVRTAGAGRSKTEIKRDYEYLMRLWSSIRETTLQSTAPALVYEEASLIKRSIRDLYGRDIEEIIVQGEDEYRIAKEFMKLFISSHAKRVKLYEEAEKPLFQQYSVEDQLASMHQPTVQLRSGGYIVINPTEALVAIDVNSGRSTRERNIEETALRTNLEAADEIARQLRLRDMAGLVVLDFIDMENPRNQGMVERRLKEAMKNDRARVQLGRISPFGLLELSRQRLRPSLIETSFEVCPACAGMGLRRTTESTALAILRKLEEEGIRHRTSELSVAVPSAVAMYLLNQKRRSLLAIEGRYRMAVSIEADDLLVPPDHRIERLRGIEAAEEEPASEVEEEAEVEEVGEVAASERAEEQKRGRRRRSRRRRREEEVQQPLAVGGDAGEEEREEADEGEDASEEADAHEEAEEHAGAAADDGDGAERPSRKRRRRGKRGGRRRARPGGEPALESTAEESELLAEATAEGDMMAEDSELEAAGEGSPYDEDAFDAGTPDGADGDEEYGAVEEVAVEAMTIEEVGGAVSDLLDAEDHEPADEATSESDDGAESEGSADSEGLGADAGDDALPEVPPEVEGEGEGEGEGEDEPVPARRRRTSRRRRKAPEEASPSAEMVTPEEVMALEVMALEVMVPEAEAAGFSPAPETGFASDGVATPSAADEEAAVGDASEPAEIARVETGEQPVVLPVWSYQDEGLFAGDPAFSGHGEQAGQAEEPGMDASGNLAPQQLHPSAPYEAFAAADTANPEGGEAAHEAGEAPHGVTAEAGHDMSDADETAEAQIAEAELSEAARNTSVIRVGEESAPGEEEPRRGWWQKLVT